MFTIERPHWTVEEAAGELGLAVSTGYRYFRSLCDAGLLTSFANSRYVLGPSIIRYDRQLRLLDPLISVAGPVMRQLTLQLPAPCLLLLCRLYQDQVMCVHQEYAEKPTFAVSYERGRPMPLFRGAASKAILVNLPLRFLRTFHAQHSDEMQQRGFSSDWKQFKARIRAMRGVMIQVAQSELDAGMMGIAAPLFEPGGNVEGSISIVLPVAVGTPELVEQASRLLRSASVQIGTLLAGLAAQEPPAQT